LFGELNDDCTKRGLVARKLEQVHRLVVLPRLILFVVVVVVVVVVVFVTTIHVGVATVSLFHFFHRLHWLLLLFARQLAAVRIDCRNGVA
jgi:hypothetical protein